MDKLQGTYHLLTPEDLEIIRLSIPITPEQLATVILNIELRTQLADELETPENFAALLDDMNEEGITLANKLKRILV